MNRALYILYKIAKLRVIKVDMIGVRVIHNNVSELRWTNMIGVPVIHIKVSVLREININMIGVPVIPNNVEAAR